MTKKKDKNLNILRKKRSFKVKKRAFLIIFKRFSVAKNCLRPESAPSTSIPSKPSENRRCFDDFRGNRIYLVCLNSLNIRSKTWK